MIVLTDGLTNPGDFEKLVREMARQKITVSTVAVGEDADRGLLKSIAQWGGGTDVRHQRPARRAAGSS